MKYITLLINIAFALVAQAQTQYVFRINADTQTASITKGADIMPLKGFEDINIATGRLGTETPIGEWKVTKKPLEMDRSHKYKCNMPYCFRTNADNENICLHEGPVFDGASSHGCIRITHEGDMAKKVFELMSPHWQNVRIQVTGSIKNYIKSRLGNLVEYAKDGSPLRFRRENGQLPDEFLKAVHDGRITFYPEDRSENISIRNTSVWYFSLEFWPDRRSKGVSYQEFTDRFHTWVQLSEEQIAELHRRHKRY